MTDGFRTRDNWSHKPAEGRGLGPNPQNFADSATETPRTETPSDQVPPRFAAATPSPRSVALADLYRHAAALAEAGDLVAARHMTATIVAMLGTSEGTPALVTDLNERRERR